MSGEWSYSFIDVALRLGAAYLLGLLVGLERNQAARTAGLRTFSLVALGACAFVLLGRVESGDDPDANARLVQGLMSGIGFIGGGAILKRGATVRGVATAASLWNAGAIGLASAWGRFDLAVLLAVINLVTLHLFQPSAGGPPQRD